MEISDRQNEVIYDFYAWNVYSEDDDVEYTASEEYLQSWGFPGREVGYSGKKEFLAEWGFAKAQPVCEYHDKFSDYISATLYHILQNINDTFNGILISPHGGKIAYAILPLLRFIIFAN